jgi:glycosyltransferase involved in cell wall biosynthesis
MQNVRFELAGAGYLSRKLEKYILSLNLGKKCRLIGYLDHKKLGKKMREADILCLPSISESWGNVITEAMACGTPVVGSNIGGIPEQIISDDYGYLCDPNSSQDIAEKILEQKQELR